MISLTHLVCLLVALVIILLGGLWILVPALYGLPTVPTKRERIHTALRLSDLQSGEVLYDLGAGDGRVLVIAARDFGARAVGIEIGPVQCAVAWLAALLNGISRQVRIEHMNFFEADLRAADVVYAYLTSSQAPRLQTCLESQLRPGARVVTISFDLSGWRPAAVDREALVFLYRMPPQKQAT